MTWLSDIMKKESLAMEEERLIEYIKRTIKIKSPDVVIGPGDDTAVLKYNSKYYLLLTTDTIVENVHFKRSHASLAQIGRKAMAVNLSDISAMGGLPLYALVSIGLPEGFQKTISFLLKGMEQMAKTYRFDIVGGNLSRSSILFIDVSMAGIVEKKNVKLRSGAGTGDGIYVTGSLGGSLAGKHLQIKPRIKESRHLIKTIPITSMMDISDGLSSDLIRLARASRKGFHLYLDLLPISKDTVKMSTNKQQSIYHALNDGEDYELLFTVPAIFKDKVPRSICQVSVTYIGKIIEEERYEGFYGRKKLRIKPSGFSHF